MSTCIQCGSPYVRFGLYCSACKQVEELQKQNSLLERNSPQESGLFELMFDKLSNIQLLAILGVVIVAVGIFWDSGLITLIRGLVVAWFELIWMLVNL